MFLGHLRNYKVNLSKRKVSYFNPFSTNVPLMDKPGSWFFPEKCLKNTCGRVTS